MNEVDTVDAVLEFGVLAIGMKLGLANLASLDILEKIGSGAMGILISYIQIDETIKEHTVFLGWNSGDRSKRILNRKASSARIQL